MKDKNVLKYLEHGEELEISTKHGTRMVSTPVKGVHNLSTCRQRKIWYDLGIHEPPSIIAPYLLWDKVIFAHNKPRALAPNTLHFLYPLREENTQYLLGILNSTLTAFLLEVEGRSYGGGVLKIEAYEMAKLSIINPEKLSRKERQKIENAFSKVCEARRELDNAVFDVLGLTEDERKQVYEGLESLRRMRLSRKKVDILVETAEKWKPHKKPKKKRIKPVEPSKRLDTWIKS